MKHYDIVIVGGGPIGIACAIEAEKANLKYIILEKGTIVNSLFNYPVNMQFFSSSERLEIDNVPFISKEAKPKRNEALEYYRRLVTYNKLNISLFDEVEGISGHNGNFTIQSAKHHISASNIILATGFYDIPNYLNVPGEGLDKVSHYYKDPHYYSSQNLAVIGASNSAVDAALECWRKGANVTMIVREKEIGRRVKYWVRPDILNRIEEGSIEAYFSSQVTEIRPSEIVVETPQGKITLDNDFVLALTGYRPNFRFLENLGIAFSGDERRVPTYDPTTMQSNVEGVYLAGVICGGLETHKWFIENSRPHAPLIVDHIKGKQTIQQN